MWDLLAHPELGDVRSRPYTERRALLLDLLHDVPLPVQGPEALPVDGLLRLVDWDERHCRTHRGHHEIRAGGGIRGGLGP